MKSFKVFISGLLIGSILLFSVSTFALGTNKTIKAIFNAVTVKIDNKIVSGDKISYNGKVYVDTNEIAKVLGKTAILDINKNINITDNNLNPTVVLKTNTSIKFSDGFTCVIDSSGLNFYKNYIAVSLAITNSKNLSKNIKIIGYNENRDKTYNKIDYSEYTSDMNYSNMAKFKNMDFYETLNREDKDISGIVVFNVSNKNLKIISFDDGIHKFELTLSSIDTPQDSNQNDTELENENDENPNDISDNSDNNSAILPLNDNIKLNSISDLKNYLNTNFSSLNTDIGKTNFTFEILENTNKYFAYDFWVEVHFDESFFYNLTTNIKYTDDQIENVKQQLKDYQEKLGRTIIAKFPNKKVKGGFCNSWYKYPAIKQDLQVLRYFSWQNYDEPDLAISDRYHSSPAGDFQWFDLIDNNL